MFTLIGRIDEWWGWHGLGCRSTNRYGFSIVLRGGRGNEMRWLIYVILGRHSHWVSSMVVYLDKDREREREKERQRR